MTQIKASDLRFVCNFLLIRKSHVLSLLSPSFFRSLPGLMTFVTMIASYLCLPSVAV
jgi:hypothetical protein